MADPKLYCTHLIGYLDAWPASEKDVRDNLFLRSKEFKELTSKQRRMRSRMVWNHLQKHPTASFGHLLQQQPSIKTCSYHANNFSNPTDNSDQTALSDPANAVQQSFGNGLGDDLALRDACNIGRGISGNRLGDDLALRDACNIGRGVSGNGLGDELALRDACNIGRRVSGNGLGDELASPVGLDDAHRSIRKRAPASEDAADSGRKKNRHTYQQRPNDSMNDQLAQVYLNSSRRNMQRTIKTNCLWISLHNIEHPVPFVGINIGTKLTNLTFGAIYQLLGLEERTHSGHPTAGELPLKLPCTFEFDPRAAKSYEFQQVTTAESDRILDASKKLYEAWPTTATGTWNQREYCVGMLCRILLKSSDQLRMVVPIRLEFDTPRSCGFNNYTSPQHYAALMTTNTNQQLILPIMLEIQGSASSRRDFCSDPHWLTPGDKVHRDIPAAVLSRLTKITEKFHQSPIIRCRDVVTFQTRTKNAEWRPRRYSDVWYLHEHLPSAHKFMVTNDGWELYSQVTSLISRAIGIACPIVWKTRCFTQPFSVVPLAAFHLQEPLLPLRDGGSLLSSSSPMLPLRDGGSLLSSSSPMLPLRDGGSGQLPLPHDRSEQYQTDESEEENDISPSPRPRPTATVYRILVDGVPSCQMFVDCHLHPEPNSRYCQYHSAKIRELLSQNWAKKRPPSTLSSHNTQILKPSRLQPYPTHKKALTSLRTLFNQNPSTTWLIDTEFCSLTRAYCSVPVEISIRNFHGKELLTCTVDYDGITIDELVKKVDPYITYETGDGRNRKLRLSRDLFLKHYYGPKTKGYTISEIRDTIHNLGYSSVTHTLLSWWSVIDLQIFFRILRGDDTPVVPAIEAGHVLNTASLCRNMQPTHPRTAKLELIHPLLCPDSTVHDYHWASSDTLAFYEVLKAILEAEG